jgi:xylulokinase
LWSTKKEKIIRFLNGLSLKYYSRLTMLLGLDLGTGSLKALLLDKNGQIIAEASRAYTVHTPQPGFAESSPNDWWLAAQEATLELGHGSEITAIGFSGQMHGLVLSDAKGQALSNAILWADTRSNLELQVYKNLEPDMRRRLANPLVTGMAGASLLWLKHHEPELLKSARWAFQPKDWLRFQLTQEAFAEPSDASGTLLYDLERDDWAFDVIDNLEIPQTLFAPLLGSSEIAETLSSTAASQLGLRAGIPVAMGGGDTPTAMFGSGILAPGVVQLSIGSGAQIVAPRDAAIIDTSLRTHLYRAVTPHGWYAMAAMQNAGLALEWVRGMLGMNWQTAYLEAFAVPPGSSSLSFLPYLMGERTPHLNPNARGAWVGLALSHTRGHLMRAAFEGVAFTIRDGFEALLETGIEAPSLRLAGGGTRVQLWRQLLADTLQRPLYTSEISSASARGAALLAGVASGVFSSCEDTLKFAPTPQLVAEPQANLEEAYERFKDLYPRLN